MINGLAVPAPHRSIVGVSQRESAGRDHWYSTLSQPFPVLLTRAGLRTRLTVTVPSDS